MRFAFYENNLIHLKMIFSFSLVFLYSVLSIWFASFLYHRLPLNTIHRLNPILNGNFYTIKIDVCDIFIKCFLIAFSFFDVLLLFLLLLQMQWHQKPILSVIHIQRNHKWFDAHLTGIRFLMLFMLYSAFCRSERNTIFFAWNIIVNLHYQH